MLQHQYISTPYSSPPPQTALTPLLIPGGPWSPFENNWHLKEDYKKLNKRQELARTLSKHILWVGIANLILCPVIVLWQILYSFFNYGELIKREPGYYGSIYGSYRVLSEKLLIPVLFSL